MTMSVDSAATPNAVERPNDPATSGSYDAGRTEQAAPPQPANEDTRGQRRAETLPARNTPMPCAGVVMPPERIPRPRTPGIRRMEAPKLQS
jgi:hypothetical protein